MIALNKTFFLSLFISIISIHALHPQKDELKTQSASERKSLTERFFKRSSTMLRRSKSSNPIIAPQKPQSPGLLVRVRSNKLVRSESFKQSQKQIQERTPDEIELRFIQLSAKVKNDKILLELASNPDDVKITDATGKNLLHVAAQHTKIITAFNLIHRGIDINAQTQTEETALSIARNIEQACQCENKETEACKHKQFVEFIEENK